ncbi:MAG TPA: NTP transferase domain-containing protein [Vicinamibacterales bacterium]|nr:NTP transferase domain-containing protein [Vicinamibacterales bacterium]
MRRLLLIPAAGLGSRLQASVPKALVPVNGRPMLDRLLELYRPFVEHAVVVAHPSFAEPLRGHLARLAPLPVAVVEQPTPTGMLDAILLATEIVCREKPDTIWITWCDQVGVLPATLSRLAREESDEPRPAVMLPTVWRPHPYIHLARDADGRIAAVLHRREGDEMPAHGESDMGLFAVSRDAFVSGLPDYAAAAKTGGATGERNFLPFLAWAATRGAVRTFPCTDPMEALGVNTPDDLRRMDAWLRARETR